MSDTCKSCGKKFVDHMGIIGTCRDLQKAKQTLRVIFTWASFRDGETLNPEHVTELIEETFDEIGR